MPKPEYWRKRLADLQTALDRDQTYLDAVQSRVNALTTDFVNRDDPAQRFQGGPFVLGEPMEGEKPR